MDQWFEKPEIVGDPTEIGTSNLQRLRAAQKGPDARRRPTAAREAYFLYVERAAEGANEAAGPFSAAFRSLSEKARMTPLTKCLPLGCFRSERRLCPRNRILGGGSEGGRCPPPSVLAEVDGHHR